MELVDGSSQIENGSRTKASIVTLMTMTLGWDPRIVVRPKTKPWELRWSHLRQEYTPSCAVCACAKLCLGEVPLSVLFLSRGAADEEFIREELKIEASSKQETNQSKKGDEDVYVQHTDSYCTSTVSLAVPLACPLQVSLSISKDQQAKLFGYRI